MSGKLATAAAFGVLTALAMTQPAPAAGPVPGYVGTAPSTVAGCPYIAWRLARDPNGQVHGIAYYSDMSGLSMVAGSITPDGKFVLTLTSQMGNGPTGEVVGRRNSKGQGEATLTGPGCANMHVVMHPVSNLTTYHEVAG